MRKDNRVSAPNNHIQMFLAKVSHSIIRQIESESVTENVFRVKQHNNSSRQTFIFIMLIMTFIYLLSSGCRPDSDVFPEHTLSSITVKTINDGMTPGSATADATGEIVFTGNDILWFNESTKEIRFRNNASHKSDVLNLNTRTIGFYIDDNYLFSAICVSSLGSQTYNSLVFYCDIIGNRYYILNGYPEEYVPSDGTLIATGEQNNPMQQIASEWSAFINQLKKEDKIKSD